MRASAFFKSFFQVFSEGRQSWDVCWTGVRLDSAQDEMRLDSFIHLNMVTRCNQCSTSYATLCSMHPLIAIQSVKGHHPFNPWEEYSNILKLRHQILCQEVEASRVTPLGDLQWNTAGSYRRRACRHMQTGKLPDPPASFLIILIRKCPRCG
jgi:hypothetical protein